MDFKKFQKEEGGYGYWLYILGHYLLAVFTPDPVDPNIFSGLYSETYIHARRSESETNGKLNTVLTFDGLPLEILDDPTFHVYYVLLDGKRIDFDDYSCDKKTDNAKIVSLVFDILREYDWLDLSEGKGKDSGIYYFNSSQVEQVEDRLCIKSSHPFAYRVSLEKIA